MFEYTYDNRSSITSKAKYTYTTGALGAAVETIPYTYGDSNWKDKLTAYNGTAITYDATNTDKLPSISNTEKAHGRIESRTYQLLTDIAWLPDKGQWTGLKAIGMVKSKRMIQGEESILSTRDCTERALSSGPKG